MQSCRILVVDDDPAGLSAAVDYLGAMLKRSLNGGLQILTATSVAEERDKLELIKSNNYNGITVVVQDVMSKPDGRNFPFKEALALGIPLIFLSGSGYEKDFIREHGRENAFFVERPYIGKVAEIIIEMLQ